MKTYRKIVKRIKLKEPLKEYYYVACAAGYTTTVYRVHKSSLSIKGNKIYSVLGEYLREIYLIASTKQGMTDALQKIHNDNTAMVVQEMAQRLSRYDTFYKDAISCLQQLE